MIAFLQRMPSRQYLKAIKRIPRPSHLNSDGVGQWELHGLKPITILIGKNGCGKTTLLTTIQNYLITHHTTPRNAQYEFSQPEGTPELKFAAEKISAERGGSFKTDGGIFTSLHQENYFMNQRKGSRSVNFRHEVASRYERLLAVIANTSSPDREPVHETIEKIMALLNTLLPQKYRAEKHDTSVKIVLKDRNQTVPFDELSSGEIEMFTLGLECLNAVHWHRGKPNTHIVLLIDEPDVHVHPDLQKKFLDFIYDLIQAYAVQVIIGTHSTVFVANARSEETGIIWMQEGASVLTAYCKRAAIDELSAMIGSHLTMQLLLNHKILLVEGQDDEEVWEQAVKSAHGKIPLYVQRCEGEPEMRKIETQINRLMEALCDPVDQPFLISLRDRDQSDGTIDSRSFVARYKLQCHEIENCILSDEFLEKFQKTPEQIGFTGDRMQEDIKSRMYDLQQAIMGDTRGWQTELGKLVGGMLRDDGVETSLSKPFGLAKFLGSGFLSSIQ